MNEENLLILYSGGADSRLLLEFALKVKKNPYCILIQYEQKHLDEIASGIRQLHDLNIPFQVLTISGLGIDSGLTGSGKKGKFEGVSEMYVSGRNTIFLSLAFSIAESKGIDTIWYGADYSDRLNLFPDCVQEYVVKFNELFEISGSKPIRVEAPLLGFTKELVFQMLESFGISKESVFSGYGGL